MKRRICIGTYQPSFALTATLDAIGISHQECDETSLSKDSFSVIILEQLLVLPPSLKARVEAFIGEGGAVLEISTNPFFFHDRLNVVRKVDFLVNTIPHLGFDRISHIDVFSKCRLSKNESAYFSGLVDFEAKSNGVIGFIGLDLSMILEPKSHKRKQFYGYGIGDSPDEIVSPVSRSEIIRLIEVTLLELHLRIQLPLITKWTSPTEKPVFAFRIDSDYGTESSLTDILDLATARKLSLTWFLHVKAHEKWLDLFHKFDSQELALHCYEHGTSTSKQKIGQDLDFALSLLAECNIETSGFAAPYGIWSEGLKKAILGYNFSYSSEFSTGYDGVPFALKLNDTEEIFQIPIHPICTGSLSRRRFSIVEMKNYFEEVIQAKVGMHEPVVLYHHPLQPGLEVVEHIFDTAVELGLQNLTFLEFSEFWQHRKSISFEAFLNDGEIEIQTNAPEDFLFKISATHSEFDLINSSQTSFSIPENPAFKYQSPSLPSHEEVEALHGDKLRLLKTSILDWKHRKTL